jgi:hypothetical protein
MSYNIISSVLTELEKSYNLNIGNIIHGSFKDVIKKEGLCNADAQNIIVQEKLFRNTLNTFSQTINMGSLNVDKTVLDSVPVFGTFETYDMMQSGKKYSYSTDSTLNNKSAIEDISVSFTITAGEAAVDWCYFDYFVHKLIKEVVVKYNNEAVVKFDGEFYNIYVDMMLPSEKFPSYKEAIGMESNYELSYYNQSNNRISKQINYSIARPNDMLKEHKEIFVTLKILFKNDNYLFIPFLKNKPLGIEIEFNDIKSIIFPQNVQFTSIPTISDVVTNFVFLNIPPSVTNLITYANRANVLKYFNPIGVYRQTIKSNAFDHTMSITDIIGSNKYLKTLYVGVRPLENSTNNSIWYHNVKYGVQRFSLVDSYLEDQDDPNNANISIDVGYYNINEYIERNLLKEFSVKIGSTPLILTKSPSYMTNYLPQLSSVKSKNMVLSKWSVFPLTLQNSSIGGGITRELDNAANVTFNFKFNFPPSSTIEDYELIVYGDLGN